MQAEKFDLWCLVELFGHFKIAGRCTERNVAGVNMLQVDVPETPGKPAFTRLFGGSAIYAINPLSEETCRAMVTRLDKEPIVTYDVSDLVRKHQALLMENKQPQFDQSQVFSSVGDDDDDENDDSFRF